MSGQTDPTGPAQNAEPRAALRALLVFLAVVFGLIAGVVITTGFLFAPAMDCLVEADFQELPPDDHELDQWLRTQPGVNVYHVGRDGNKLTLDWVNVNSYPWGGVTPNVRKEFERFGYKGLLKYREQKEPKTWS